MATLDADVGADGRSGDEVDELDAEESKGASVSVRLTAASKLVIAKMHLVNQDTILIDGGHQNENLFVGWCTQYSSKRKALRPAIRPLCG